MEPFERRGIEAQWFLVREMDGMAYFASDLLMHRCEVPPLLPATAFDAVARVLLHNAAGAIPALVTEAEEMFMPYQVHRWAVDAQIYCPVYDPWV